MTHGGRLSAPFDASCDASRFREHQERVEVLVEAQRSFWNDEPGAWVVLPLDHQPPVFALVAADTEGERRGREVIGAFVGPAIAHLEPAPLALSAEANADQILRAHGIGNVVALRHESGSLAELLTALELLVTVRSTQPTLRREAPPALAFLLRDYWLSLQQRDAAASERLLSQIEADGSLSADNLRFLRVDRLASLGRWDELADSPAFRDMTRTPRPRRISEQLMEALWTTRIESEQGVTAARHALERFESEQLSAEFGSLLRSVDVPLAPKARSLAALSAVADGNMMRLERIANFAMAQEREFINELVSWHSQRSAGPPEIARETATYDIRHLVQAGDWESVLACAEERPGDPLAAEAAVRAAFETADTTLARRAMAVLSRVPEADLAMSPGLRIMLEAVRASGGDDCTSWTAWFDRIGRNQKWTSASEVLRDNYRQWTIDDLSAQAASQSAAASLLAAADGINADQVSYALDLLCALAQSLASLHVGDALAQAIILIVSDQANPSRQVREALRDLLEYLLDAGPNVNRYAEYVGIVLDLWQKVQSLFAFDWALDIADLLATAPCPSAEARVNFVTAVIAWAHRHVHKLEQRHVIFANAVAAEIGVEAGLAVTATTALPQAEIWARLDGARIGLYSLLPKAGSRLKERLADLAPDARVEQSSDTVGTSTLKSLASNADYMLVDTWHATHSATAAIDSVLPRDRQLFPRGGGVMSFLAALQARLESVA